MAEAGRRYDGHPDFDSVDISSVGYWGEGWSPYMPDFRASEGADRHLPRGLQADAAAHELRRAGRRAVEAPRRCCEGRVYLPDDLAPGEYRLRLALLDPRTLKPAIRLAIEGREDDGWYGLGSLTVE